MTNILVIEDDPQIQILYMEMLSNEGYSVKCVDNAIDAEVFVINNTCDIIILDFFVKGSAGETLALALRGLGYSGPIILVTGLPVAIDPVIYDKINFAGRLLKPWKREELVSEISKHLSFKES